MNKEEGGNLEQINKDGKAILNFGDLSFSQRNRGIKIEWNEAWIKCRRVIHRLRLNEIKSGKWVIERFIYLKHKSRSLKLATK